MTKTELIAQVKKIASSYSLATGVDCMVLEKRPSNPVQISGVVPKSCRTCASAGNSLLPLSCQCQQHKDYFFPAANNHNYIHMCRFGFIFWGSSIIWQGQHLATILAYSSLLKEESETLKKYKEELSKRVRQDTNFTEILDYAPKRIQGMAQILFLCCQALSGAPAIPQTPNSLAEHPNSQIPVIQRSVAPRSLYNIQYQGEDVYDIIENIFTSSQSDLEATKLKIRELSQWLAKIADASGTLDETALSANLSLLKQIENQESADQLYDWLNEIANSFYKTAFRLHDLQHGDALARAIRYMHQKYDEDISMESVSEIANLSYSYFSRIFKKEIGVNFNDYLNQIRIEKSKKLLIKNEMSLLDIAQKCGFKDQSYYSKSFKKITGISPGKFRGKMKYQNK